MSNRMNLDWLRTHGAAWIAAGLLAASNGAWADDNLVRGTPSAEEFVRAMAPEDEPRSRGPVPAGASKAMSAPSISVQIKFALNSFSIRDESAETLRNFEKAIKSERLKDNAFKIVGHTDASGSDVYNLALSSRRANAVRDYLVRLGAEGSRLEAVGKGKTELQDK